LICHNAIAGHWDQVAEYIQKFVQINFWRVRRCFDSESHLKEIIKMTESEIRGIDLLPQRIHKKLTEAARNASKIFV
jgi:hypothetical protein